MWLYDLLFSLDVKAILLFIVFFLLVANFLKNRNAENYPPGPLALPLVGHLFNVQMYSTIWHFLCFMQCPQLTKAYGNVFSIRFGRDKMVFVCGYKMVKEAIVTQAENFVDRPYIITTLILFITSSLSIAGLFTSNGETWKKQRRFALSTLRNFGLGKSSMEQSICEECHHLLEEMEKEKGGAFHPARLFNNAVSNIICQLVMGRRFDYSDHNFQILLKYLSGLYEAFPGVMKHLPGPHNKIFTHRLLNHIFWLSSHHSLTTMYLCFISEQHQGESNLGFSEANLALCSLDLFVAGTETTSTTLLWALTFLIKNPDVQAISVQGEKVQAEIDRVIGQTRQPTMADRPNMPYTDAVIHEIQRMGNIVPLNGLRMAAKDTTLGGYFIPKGTALMPMLTSVLFDKNEWETPDTFNPRHFLDAEGKFVRREAFLPFSAGKRVCLGEGLARMELFLFFVSLFQKFTFSTLDGVELDTEGVIGTTHVPKPFKVYAKAR
uniref:Cytochrome P450, family 2, subfamily N, polypeptide 13 n=1 Tax=Myripristis murdjan TaxID=586833 RepID=A0A667WM51_9TELE